MTTMTEATATITLPPQTAQGQTQVIKMSAPKSLLMGAPGAGKTTSLVSYIKAGIELFVVSTEPGGEEALLDAMRRFNLPLEKLHWKYIPAAAPSWDTLGAMAKTITSMGYKDLTEIKQGANKSDYQQFLALIKCLSNFQDQRTGLSYGAVDSWGDDKALCIDSLSGISTMAMDMVMGNKPAAHQGEWGVAMNALEKLIGKLTSDVYCHLCLTAHLEREQDEVAGIQKVMLSTLGKKLAPKIPKMFSDVILAHRDGAKFLWSTNTSNHELKARNLPLSDKLEPDFGQLVRGWETRKKLASSQQ